MAVKAIPDGYHTLTPYIVNKDASKVIEFLKEAFGAEEIRRTDLPNGRVANAELRIGTSMVMVAEAQEEYGPKPATIYMYVTDTDGLYKKAIDAGAKSIMEPSDQFYGDRNAGVEDLAGNQWWIATHIEDVSPEEIAKRAAAAKH